MSLTDELKNIGVMAGDGLNFPTNAPTQYGDRQKQYYGAETAVFTEKYAQYASDFFVAQVQGLDPDDFLAWSTESLRLADIVKSSSAITRQNDDYKAVLFASRNIDYVPRGAKIIAAGSTWLVTNPKNISSAVANAVAERCNAVWCHFDYYGNVLKEPLVITGGTARASSNDSGNFTLLTEGYYTAKMQINPDTASLGQNSRIILGSKAYAITGMTDFIQEFTGDDESVRVQEFTLRYEEPNLEIDDLDNKVAGGKNFSWQISIKGASELPAGMSENFTAESNRNGVTVYDSENYPISYLWSSTNEDVAIVNEQGTVTAVSEGSCEIVCTLAQNPAQRVLTALTVTAAEVGGRVRFEGYVPESIEAYESAVISAAYFNGGEKTEEIVGWDFGGAADGTYTAITDGNNARITCYGYSETPLTVTAKYGEYTATAKINLLGV